MTVIMIVQGRIDFFSVEGSSVGEIKHVKVEVKSKDGKSAAEPWFLQQITVSDDVSTAKKTFEHGEFINSGNPVTLSA